MPIYEYYSPDTHKIYSFFAKSTRYKDIIPPCPDGQEHKMEKMVSSFAFVGSTDKAEKANQGDGNNDPDLEDPRMMQAMGEMEKAIAGMDEDNPDPKVMGQMMRKMADITGEKMDEGMNEMIAKLEEGQDPEALEAEMGDLLGDDLSADPNAMNSPNEESGNETKESGTAKLKQLLKNKLDKRNAPIKDSKLYDYPES
jgi:hypothetical protein|tara:strand:+ start:1152 stop:1745 length:594 start_codon:yes stop_codon:yes gene_type:complete